MTTTRATRSRSRTVKEDFPQSPVVLIEDESSANSTPTPSTPPPPPPAAAAAAGNTKIVKKTTNKKKPSGSTKGMSSGAKRYRYIYILPTSEHSYLPDYFCSLSIEYRRSWQRSLLILLLIAGKAEFH